MFQPWSWWHRGSTDIEGKPHNFKDSDISTDSDVNWCKYVKLSVTWGCFLTEIDRTEIDRKQLCVGDMYILICLLTTCLQLIHVFTSIDYVGQCMFRVWFFCCNSYGVIDTFLLPGDRSIPLMPHDIMRLTNRPLHWLRVKRPGRACDVKWTNLTIWCILDGEMCEMCQILSIKDLGWRYEPRFSEGTQGALPRRHHSDCFEIVIASGNQRWLAGKSSRNMDSMNGKIIHKYLY